MVDSYRKCHKLAGKVLPMECSQADETCKGRLECALRKDAPIELVRSDKGGRYFSGDPLVGYIRLCRSHHVRYDSTPGWFGSQLQREFARKAGSLSGISSGYPQHVQWHVNRGITRVGCRFCNDGEGSK